MWTRRLTFVLMGSVGALVCATTLPADEPVAPAGEIAQVQPTGEAATLGYSVKLEFKVIHPEGTPTFFTHCCGGEFSVSEDISEPNHEHTMRFEGTLLRGDDDGRLLLQYDVQGHHSDLNEGFEADHSATGSALLRPGEMVTLTILGDAPLQVTATRDE